MTSPSGSTEPEPASVETFAELLHLMDEGECEVFIKLCPEFGTEHIGCYREASFYLEDKKLSQNTFTKRLESQLVNIAGLPETSKDYFYDCEVTLRKVENTLHADFYWEKYFPYDYPCETKRGSAEVTM